MAASLLDDQQKVSRLNDSTLYFRYSVYIENITQSNGEEMRKGRSESSRIVK